MKKRIIRIALLSIALVLTVILGASCSFINPSSGQVCPHETIALVDCSNTGICTLCNKPVEGYYGSHVYKENYIDATCTESAYVEYVCKVCSHTYRETAQGSYGHSFGEWIFTKQPTPTESGEMYRVCTRCDKKETETVPPHEHSLANGEGKSVSCTEDGWDAFEYCTKCSYSTQVIIPTPGHDWGEYTSIGGGMHSRTCKNDPSHTVTESCSGGSVTGDSLPVCEYCNTEYELAVRAGNSTYGYYALGEYTSGEDMQRLYKELIKACEDFYVSDSDLEIDGKYYVIGRFDLGEYSLSEEAGMAVWKVFYVSNPVYYWLDASIVMEGDSLLLTVADDYAKTSDRRANDQAIAEMTAECSALIDGSMTDLEKAMAISAFIVKGMEYAYESDGVTPEDDMWAHCMAGFAMHGYGVCEAYAKSFMYLSLLNGVDCIMGSGYAGEPHAWNYVKLDGEWYGVDLTWTDNSGDEVYYDKFGLSDSSIHIDHFPHSSTVLGDEFMYAHPTLATKDLELTALYKNGEYVGMYKSIDSAFAAMTDKDAEYEIDIAYYSFYVGAITHSVTATATPDVKKLTITGRNEFVGEGYLDRNTALILSGSLTLGSDLQINNVDIRIADGAGDAVINLAGHTLTVAGDSTSIDTAIVGTDANSSILISAADYVRFVGGVDVYRLTVSGEGIAIYGSDSRIKYYTGDIYTEGSVTVEAEHRS